MSRRRALLILGAMFVVLMGPVESHGRRNLLTPDQQRQVGGATVLLALAFGVLYAISRGTTLHRPTADGPNEHASAARDQSLIPSGFHVDDPVGFINLIQDRASTMASMMLRLRYETELPAVRRYCSDDGYRRLLNEVPHWQRAYDRPAINFARVERIDFQSGVLRALVTVQYIYRQLPNAEDPSGPLVTEQAQVSMIHRPVGATTRGAIDSNRCRACGFAEISNVAAICTACGSPLNDMTRDWLLDHLHLKR